MVLFGLLWEIINMSGAVILLSGGVDSTTLLFYLKKRLKVDEIHALSFFYGQKHSRELEMARWQAAASGIESHREVEIPGFADLTVGGSALTDVAIDVPSLGDVADHDRDQPPTYVPNRNMVMLSLAAAFAESIGIQDVFYGAQSQDEYGYWDCTIDFVSKINDVLGLNRRVPVRVNAPFVTFSKVDVVRLGVELGVDFDHTWTCYRGDDLPCGECPSCVERKSAFSQLQ